MGLLLQPNGDLATSLLYGMVGIGDQVHRNLVDLRRICHDQATVALNPLVNLDIRRDRRTNQLQYLRENLLDPYGFFSGSRSGG